MELDELKQAWQTLDRHLQQHNALSLQALKQRQTDKARAGLRPMAWGQCLQVLFGLAVLALALACWARHRDVPLLLVSGLVMQVYGVLAIAMGGAMLSAIGRIDYAQPIVAIQAQLARLRRQYVIGGLVLGLPWWILWMPMLLVVIGALMPSLPTGGLTLALRIWIALGVGSMGLVACGALWLYARHPDRTRLRQALADRLSGGSLRRAQSALDEIARFARD
jgi:hypothetical protein